MFDKEDLILNKINNIETKLDSSNIENQVKNACNKVKIEQKFDKPPVNNKFYYDLLGGETKALASDKNIGNYVIESFGVPSGNEVGLLTTKLGITFILTFFADPIVNTVAPICRSIKTTIYDLYDDVSYTKPEHIELTGNVTQENFNII